MGLADDLSTMNCRKMSQPRKRIGNGSPLWLRRMKRKQSQAQESIRILTNQLNELNLDEAQEQVAYWNTRLAVIEQSVNSLQSRKSERQQSVDRFVSQQQDVQAKLGETENLLKELDEEKSILRERESVMHNQIEELRVQIEPAEKDLETAEQEETRLQEVETNAQRNLASAERMVGQIQLDLVRREEGLDNLRQRIIDDFGLVSFEYAANIEGPVPLPFEGLVEQLPVVMQMPPDLEEHMTQQRAQLRRMGAINPDAKKEYRFGIGTLFVYVHAGSGFESCRSRFASSDQ